MMRNNRSFWSLQRDCAASKTRLPLLLLMFSNCSYSNVLPLHRTHHSAHPNPDTKGMTLDKIRDQASYAASRWSNARSKNLHKQQQRSLSHLTLRHKPTKVLELPVPVDMGKSYQLQAPLWICAFMLCKVLWGWNGWLHLLVEEVDFPTSTTT